MTVLIGHPTGNPNSHNAALAHWEAGWLEAFCVPWMPTHAALGVLGELPLSRRYAARLSRRTFDPLLAAPKVQGKAGEAWRLLVRALGFGDESLSYAANDWVMRTMAREAGRPRVTAVHAYEDAALGGFQAARRLGKACVYDMPTCYFPAWNLARARLAAQYPDLLPHDGFAPSPWERPEQKEQEMAMADLVLAPCNFVRASIAEFADKRVALAPYGVDTGFWHGEGEPFASEGLRFIFAGQCSVRKGVPLLIEAWRAAGLRDASLELVGAWRLPASTLASLPPGVRHTGPQSPEGLRARYRAADVMVFPSFFEGFGLVILEAMACGLPVIASDTTAGPDILQPDTGRVVPSGNVEALAESLKWFEANRASLPGMRRAARASAERWNWARYRGCVRSALAEFA
jgi:glycosyltransferase involved in cell wall biosynthesis